MSNKKSFIESAFILMIAAATVKIIGALYKIPLSNLLGAEGMGIFSIAYNIYSILFVLSTAALPVAISKIISNNIKSSKYSPEDILKTCLKFFGSFSFVCMIVLIYFRENITMGNEKATLSIICIAPALFFVSIISIFRGYYQGLSNMYPTAISQVIEALFKLIIGFSLAFYLLPFGIDIASAGAISGVTFGTFFAMLFLCFKPRPKASSRTGTILPSILKTVIPITISSSVLSITGIIDMFLVMNRLRFAGFSISQSNTLYGAYNMALNLVNLPQTIIMAISISIVPLIASRLSNKDTTKTIKSAMKITLTLAIPSSFAFISMAKPILNIIYFNKPNDVILIIPILQILAVAIVFIALSTITTSILQALGKTHIPIISMLIACIVKIFAGFLLIGNKDINIYGLAISSILCFFIISFINICFLSKYLGLFKEKVKLFLMPLLASVTMSMSILLILINFSHKIGDFCIIILAFTVGLVVYLIMLVLLGGINKNDIYLLPSNDSLSKSIKA